MDLNIRERNDGVTLECYISPRAKKSSIRGLRQGALSISLNAPPVDGKANKSLVDFISKLLGVSKRSISIITGKQNKQKVLFIQGVDRSDMIELIEAELTDLP